jgi:hypothetical protein
VKESNASRIAVLLTLINHARVEVGLPALQFDDRLANAATNHAHIMAQKGQLSHQFPGEPDLTDRLAPQLRLDQAGENVVYDVTVQGAHEAFMGSPLHRINVLNGAYDSVGIGIVENGGVIYVVEDFAHRVPDLNDDDAAERVAEQFSLEPAACGQRTIAADGLLHGATRDPGWQSAILADRSPVCRILRDRGPGSVAIECGSPLDAEWHWTFQRRRLLRTHPKIPHRTVLGNHRAV